MIAHANGHTNGHKSLLVDQFGRDMPRNRIAKELADLPANRQRRSRLTYDALRDSTEYRNIFANADRLDADSANDMEKRHKAMSYSRYEAGSNGYYAGIISTHVNMLVGVGPALRMLSDNVQWNRFVELGWWKWCQAIQFRRKLWCMGHAKTQDGEGLGVMVTNPNVRHEVQLDIVLIEGEQCHTPFLPFLETGYIDGIKFDEFGNPEWYDVLPEHPGSARSFRNLQNPIRVPASQMLHWFKMRRPGQHRGMPDCISTLNVGAAARRFREATLGAAETAAEPSLVLETQYQPDELDVVDPMSTLDFQKRMITALPNNMRMNQVKAEHPNAQYNDFHRQLISEQARPLSMPFNAAACDSSTYSFASGKLDNLLYYAGADVDRKDCDDLVMDKLFSEWFREFVLASDSRRNEEDVSDHQWDWPEHPVIDEVAHANANQTNLSTGERTLTQVYSEAGKDFQDGLVQMAEEYFGEATDENIAKVRKICVLRNTPQHAIQQVAQLLGIEAPQPKPSPAQPPAIEDQRTPEPQGAAA